MCCSAVRRRTSRSRAVKVTAWRSASSAEGAEAIWTAGLAGAWADWVVVSPFSSMEREKMTWRLICASGGAACAAGSGAGGEEAAVCAAPGEIAIQRKAVAAILAGKNLMSPNLSVSLVWTRRQPSGKQRWLAVGRCRGAGGRLHRAPPLRLPRR